MTLGFEILLASVAQDYPIDPVAKVFAGVFLVTTMFSIGLKITARDLLASLRNPVLMAKTLGANFLIIPAVGLLMASIFPMSVHARAGFILLAIAPGGLNAVQFTSKTPAGLSYAAATLFILSFLSVLVSPLLASAILSKATSLTLPYGRIAAWLLLGVLGPLLIGLVVHHSWGRIASRLAMPIAIVGTVSFVVVMILLWTLRKQAQQHISRTELGGMLLFILAAMAIGWAMGGPNREIRRILATGSSMRNAALCLMIAAEGFPDNGVDVAVIAFSAMMIPLNMAYTVYGLVRQRQRHSPTMQIMTK